MAALTAGTRRRTRHEHLKMVDEYAAGTSAIIFEGALINLSTATGRAVPATAAAAREFLGIAENACTGNTAGTVYVKVAYMHQALINFNTTQSNTLLMTDVAIKTDNDVCEPTNAGAASVRVTVGQMVQYEDGDAWIWLRHGRQV